MIKERGYSGFRIRHFLYYRIKHYLSPFIRQMLQLRKDLAKLPNSALKSTLLKLVLNGESLALCFKECFCCNHNSLSLSLSLSGLYGFCSVEACSFAITKLLTESYLKRSWERGVEKPRKRKQPDELEAVALLGNRPQSSWKSQSQQNKKRKRSGLYDPNVYEISLVGAIRRLNKTPDLLYSVTSHCPDKPITNIAQISGAILGQSRNIFFGKILAMLRVFQHGSFELSYTGETFFLYFFKKSRKNVDLNLPTLDTDSVIAAVSCTDMTKLVRPELADRWPDISSFLFADEEGETEQSGQFRVSVLVSYFEQIAI